MGKPLRDFEGFSVIRETMLEPLPLGHTFQHATLEARNVSLIFHHVVWVFDNSYFLIVKDNKLACVRYDFILILV